MKLYITILIGSFMVFCASAKANKNNSSLPLKSSFLSFSVKIDRNKQDSSIIVLNLKNITSTPVTISAPSCPGVFVMPFITNISGDTLPLKFRIKAFCKESKILLAADSSTECNFLYTIEECYSLKKGESYILHFEYRGHIYGKDNTVIANNAPLLSNEYKFQY